MSSNLKSVPPTGTPPTHTYVEDVEYLRLLLTKSEHERAIAELRGLEIQAIATSPLGPQIAEARQRVDATAQARVALWQTISKRYDLTTDDKVDEDAGRGKIVRAAPKN